MAPKLFGGLLLENVVKQDEWYRYQFELFSAGLIQGAQIRIAHPDFTPGLNFEQCVSALERLLDNDWGLFVHVGSENMGVDLGERFDEKGIFAEMGAANGLSWRAWNEQTITWAMGIANRLDIGAVIHAGYASSPDDQEARQKIKQMLPLLAAAGVAIENVPPAAERTGGVWDRKGIWGVGGTPNEMSALLASAPGLNCLIDFTHLWVGVNQARELAWPELNGLTDVSAVVDGFMSLPHSPVCHFSGLPPTLEDNHDYLLANPDPVILRALSQHEVICLEIPFRQGADQQIQAFKVLYNI